MENDFYLPPRHKRRYIGLKDTINSKTDELHKAGAILNLDHLEDDQIQRLWMMRVIDVQEVSALPPVENVVNLAPLEDAPPTENKKKKRG